MTLSETSPRSPPLTQTMEVTQISSCRHRDGKPRARDTSSPTIDLTNDNNPPQFKAENRFRGPLDAEIDYFHRENRTLQFPISAVKEPKNPVQFDTPHFQLDDDDSGYSTFQEESDGGKKLLSRALDNSVYPLWQPTAEHLVGFDTPMSQAPDSPVLLPQTGYQSSFPQVQEAPDRSCASDFESVFTGSLDNIREAGCSSCSSIPCPHTPLTSLGIRLRFAPFNFTNIPKSTVNNGLESERLKIPDSYLGSECKSPYPSYPARSSSLSDTAYSSAYQPSSSSFPESGYDSVNATPPLYFRRNGHDTSPSTSLSVADSGYDSVNATPPSYFRRNGHDTSPSTSLSVADSRYASIFCSTSTPDYSSVRPPRYFAPNSRKKRKRNPDPIHMEESVSHPPEKEPMKTFGTCPMRIKAVALPPGAIVLSPTDISAVKKFLTLVLADRDLLPATTEKCQSTDGKDKTMSDTCSAIPDVLKTDAVSSFLSSIPIFDQQKDSDPHSQGQGVPTPVHGPAEGAIRPMTKRQSNTARCEAMHQENSEASDSEGESEDDEENDNQPDEPHHLNDEGDEYPDQLSIFHLLDRDTWKTCESRSSMQWSTGSGSGNSSGIGSTTTSSSVTAPSPADNPPTSDQNARKGTESLAESNVAVDSNESQAKCVFGPLPLVCWHAANRIRCNGKCGRSPEARRLLDDHSLSKKSSNHHKLPPPCTRCKRLFESEDAAEQHKELLRSDPSCPILTDEQLYSANLQINRTGISENRQKEIFEALRNFSKGKLPLGCDQRFFDDWVARNTPLYIGRSDKTDADARRELGKWFVVFCTQFPGERVPSNPFLNGCEGTTKYDRILELSHNGFARDSSNNVLPSFSQAHLARMREIVKEALELSHLELLQEASSTQKPKAAQRANAKRRKAEDGDLTTHSSFAQTMLPPTPAPQPLSFHFGPSHPAATVFIQPSPGGVVDPPPTPVYSESQTPAAPDTASYSIPGNSNWFSQWSQPPMSSSEWDDDPQAEQQLLMALQSSSPSGNSFPNPDVNEDLGLLQNGKWPYVLGEMEDMD